MVETKFEATLQLAFYLTCYIHFLDILFGVVCPICCAAPKSEIVAASKILRGSSKIFELWIRWHKYQKNKYHSVSSLAKLKSLLKNCVCSFLFFSILYFLLVFSSFFFAFERDAKVFVEHKHKISLHALN